jgi:MGT family glycosyltransferase
MDHAAAMAGLMNANFVQANCEAMMRLIADVEPDAIVDFWNPFACIAARALGIPLVTVIQADAHPGNPGFIWWKDPPTRLPSATPATNKVLARFGLSPIEKLDDLNLGDLTLILGTPQTDPVPDSTNCAYIGPILWQKPDAEPPPWLEELDDSTPVVWVYSGNPRYGSRRTAWDSEIVLEACIDVLARLDLQVVLTTGHHALPGEYEPLPGNFRFAPYVPGLTMAERSDLLIHHGGYGSCQTGLFTGTPAVIIPTFAERESNARRIANLGAGETILPVSRRRQVKQIDLAELQRKVECVLSDPSYAERAAHYGEILKLYGGSKEAARLIEDVVVRVPS